MKTIVFIQTRSGTQKHSAWHSITSALRQIDVLENHGYKNSYFSEIEHSYEDGQYFV